MVYAVAVLILAASFLCVAYPCSAVESINSKCSNVGNYPPNGPYKHNLDALLTNLSSVSSRIGFSEHTEGNGTNQVYGSHLCLADLPQTNCSNCVRDSAVQIMGGSICANKMKASVWSRACILQYSNDSFFGTWQHNNVTWCDYDHFFQDARFDKLLSDTLTQAANKAAADQTPGSKFGTMEADLTFLGDHLPQWSSRTLYTRAQCAPDLSQADCLQCLNQSITTDLPQRCHSPLNGTTKYGRTISSSCIIRYDTTPFYIDPVPDPGPKKEKNIRRIIVIVGICMSAVMLLAVGMLLLWRYLRNRIDLDDFEGINMEEITTAESLQMDFRKVRTATLNFAPDRKLGEGGFGDVYMKRSRIEGAKLGRHRGQVRMVYEVDVLLFLVAASFLCLAHPCSAGEFMSHNCSKEGHYSSGGPYKYNLDLVLANLTSESSRTGFSEHTEGTGNDQVYGSYLCRGDLPQTNCSNCVRDAKDRIIGECPNQIKAQIWFDECILQFSNEPYFGTWQQDYMSWCGFSRYFQDARFDKLFSGTLTQVARKAAADQTPGRKFGTMEANLTFLNESSSTLYTLAQCLPNLSPDICLQCLNQSTTFELPHYCHGQPPNGITKFGKTLSSSCIIWYDTNRFYNDQVPAPAPEPIPSTPALPPLLLPPLHALPALPKAVNEDHKNIRRILVIVGICISVVMLLLAVGILLWRYQRNRMDMDDFEGINMEEITTAESLQMDFSKVRAATLNFAPDRKLGEGGFGDVYMGKLENGQDIAVKRLTASKSGQGTAEFKNEVVLVAKLQHRNLVKLLGFCLTAKEKILVYEYLPNSSLDKLLFDPIKRATLDWEKRFNIISGIAKGLLYLLEDSRLRIIHRDLKSSNILLDKDMNPKISDFGIAKTLALDQTRASTEILAGTYGYMAPEYLLTGQYSLKSDIYSFGIIVLEIVTGQRNFHGRPLLEEALLYRAWRLWNENAELDMVDPELNDAYSAEEIVKCIHIGLLCIQEDAGKRPRMSSVVAALSGKCVDLPAPTPPNFFNISRSIDMTSGSSSATTSTTSTSGTHSSFFATHKTS